MSALDDLKKKYGIGEPANELDALKKKYGIGDTVIRRSASQSSGVFSAPETFTTNRAEPVKETTPEVVAGTGLGLGMTLPTLQQATGALAGVSKQMHEDATEGLDQLKKDKRAAAWDPSSRNPESENFKTNEDWDKERESLEGVRDTAAKNYYGFAGQDAVNKVLGAKGTSGAFNAAVEAAVTANDLLDKYRNGGWTPEAATAMKNATEAQGRAVELLVPYGVDKATAERAIEYQAGLVRQGKAAARAQETAEWAKEHKGLASVISVGTNPTQGLDYLNALARNQGHNSTKDLESYRPITGADFQNTAYTEALRSGASSELGAVGKFLYDTGMSMVDSFVLANTVGPLTGVLLGAGAASSSAKNALDRGATNKQALAVGFAAGAAEMLFESLSVERLLKIQNVGTAKQYLKSFLQQGVTEGSEEVFTEIANILTDTAIMGQNSNFEAAVKAYQKEGLSEEAAMRKAYLDSLVQVGLAAAGGFLSGAVMGGAQATPSYVYNKAYQNYLEKNLNTNQIDILSVAQEFAVDSETRKLADQISTAINDAAENDRKVEISPDQWGRLMQSMEAERDQFGPADPGAVDKALHPNEDTLTATAQALIDAGADAKTANTKGALLERLRSGDSKLSNEELRALDLNSPATRAVFKSLLGVELPGVTDGHVLNRAALDAARSIAAQRTAQVEQNLEEEVARMVQEKTAQMSEPVQPAGAQETQNPDTETATGEESRASVGEIAPETSVAPDAVKMPQRGSAKSLLDYVTRVNQSNADVRQRTQETTVKVLNSNLKALGATATIEVKNLGQDGPAAQWNPDGRIELNADVLDKDGGYRHASQHAIVYTLTHELFHEASSKQGGESSQWTKAQANELIEFGKNMVGEEKWAARVESMRNAQISAMMKDGYTREQAEARLTEDYLNEELAADVLRDVFASQGKLNLFAKEHRSTLTKIRDWLQKKFDALLGRPDAGNHELVQEMNRIIKNVNEALTKTVERDTDKAETTTQEAKYSAEGREETDSRAGEISGRLREPGARSEDSGDVPGRGVRSELGGNAAQMADEAKGRSSRNERVESREDFLDRAKRAGKKIRIIKGAAVAYRDVPLISASKAARQAVRTARRLGETDAIVFSGSVEFNHNGVTGYPSREASTLGKEMLAFSDSLTMPPVEAATHEVAHKWMGTDRGKQYMDFVLSQYKSGTKFEAELREAYKPEKVDEEKVAYLSGWMEDGFSDAKLSHLVDNPVAVRKAWEDLKAEMVGKNRRYSVPTLADTNTEEFRQWFNDDSGELTNPDSTPKFLMRGTPLSGPTKFRDYRESYSPGIFLTPDLYAAKNYATKRTTQYGAPEFIPRHLSTWNEAFQWVDNGGLGEFVSLEREGSEWVFSKRNAMIPPRWDDVATYPNTQEGLEKFNAEYGDLMRNAVFTDGRAVNPGYMRGYATATKTKVIDAQGRIWLNVDDKWSKTDDLVREAWDEGYDCVVIKNVQDGGEEIGVGFDENDNYVTQQKPIDVIVVKDSGQFKSAYNTGSFDRNNPDVRYSPNTDYQTGGNTGNVNPETGFRRGSVADSFMRIWNTGAQDEAINTLEYILTRLAELEAEAQERNLRDLRAAVLKPRVTEEIAERNRRHIERLIERYGMIPQTSGAQQEVRLPERIDDETYVAGATQTIMSHEVTNELIGDELVQDILSGNAGVTYARIGDRETLEQVDDEFERQGVDGFLRQWKNKVNGKEGMTKLDIARAEKLYVELAGAKEFTDESIRDILDLVAEISAAGTQAGQTVQAMTLLKKMTPTGQLYYIQKAVDRLNRSPNQKSPITINEQLAKQLAEAKTISEINAAVDAIITDIAQQVPVSLADRWNTWRYFAMLCNPRTHIRNLFGNAIFTPARLAKNVIGTGLERVLLRGESADQRTKAIVSSKELRDFAEQDSEEMKDILRSGGKYNTSDMIRDKRVIFKKAPWLNTATQKNSELLEKEDWIFLRSSYRSALAGFLSARGITDVNDLLDTNEGRKTLNEAREYAVREAQRATYRDASKLASWLNNAKRNGGKLSWLLEGVIPFTKTPINIIKRGFEYSPLGIVKTIYDATNRGVAKAQREQGKTVKRDILSAADIIDELAANLTGTGAAVLGVLLSRLGLLTAGLGDDDEDKFKELYGDQAYSLNIPGVGSYTIDWMAPVALPLFVGAEIYNTIAEDYGDLTPSEIVDAVADGMTTILEPMLSLSMLDGVNEALSANKFGDSEDALWNIITAMLGSYVSQGIPTVFGQVARTIDPDRRTTFTEKGEGKVESKLKRFWQSSVQGKVPVYQNDKLAYVDAWGRTDTTGNVLLRAFENFISPGYINSSRKTGVETELERLAKAEKDTSVMPDRAAKYFSVNKETYAMSKDEYEAHLIDRGQTSYRLVSDFINDPVYQQMSDKDRVAVIRDIYEYAKQTACYHTNAGYDRNPWVTALDEYVANGGDAVDYLSVRVKSGNGVSMSEVAYGRDDLSQRDVGAILRLDSSGREYSGREYSMTAEQQAYYTNLWDDTFNEEFADLYGSRKYRNADPEERAELVKELRADVTKEVKRDVERWLRSQGVKSTKK